MCCCFSQCIRVTTLQRKSHYVLLFWELRGLSPNFHIHVSESDLYIPTVHFFALVREAISNDMCISKMELSEFPCHQPFRTVGTLYNEITIKKEL
jgi:hypothetical protein